MKLQVGTFGTEFSPAAKNPFGLHTGQMRMPDVKLTHNAGWYNAEGVKVGWGDLDAEDFIRIRVNLEPGELFVILAEADSFWNFVQHHGHLGSTCTTSPEEAHPGKKYIAEHALFIISKDRTFHVDEWFKDPGSARERNIFGIRFDVINREECQKMLAG